MKTKFIVRAREGTARRKVAVDKIAIPDVRMSTAIQFHRDRASIYRLYDDVSSLLNIVRHGANLPSDFYVPDLWHTAQNLPAEDTQLVLELWHLSHDLAKETGYTRNKPSDKAI